MNKFLLIFLGVVSISGCSSYSYNSVQEIRTLCESRGMIAIFDTNTLNRPVAATCKAQDGLHFPVRWKDGKYSV